MYLVDVIDLLQLIFEELAVRPGGRPVAGAVEIDDQAHAEDANRLGVVDGRDLADGVELNVLRLLRLVFGLQPRKRLSAADQAQKDESEYCHALVHGTILAKPRGALAPAGGPAAR